VARRTHQREDLLRDATALEPRIELVHRGRLVKVFAGFRGDCLSLYFGENPVFHFNSRGELRRAFVDGQLLKANHGALTTLKREQSESKSILRSRPFRASEATALFADLDRRLLALSAALRDAEYETRGQVPPEGDALPRLVQWLDSRPAVAAAESPRVD